MVTLAVASSLFGCKSVLPRLVMCALFAIVPACDGAALECIQKLGRVKTEYFAIAKITDHAVLVGAAKRVRRIVDHFEPVLVCQGAELVDRARPAV